MERTVFTVIKDNHVIAHTYYLGNAYIHQANNHNSEIYRIVEGQETLNAMEVRKVGTPLHRVEMMQTTLDFSTVKFKDREHIACIWSQWFPEGCVQAPKGKKIIVIQHPISQDPLKPDIGVEFFTSILSQVQIELKKCPHTGGPLWVEKVGA